MFGFLQVVCRKEQSVLRGLSEDINHNAGYVSLIKCCFVSECMCVCVCQGVVTRLVRFEGSMHLS
jgi:hypothetical protein